MATPNRKQRQLNETYRKADINRVGGSLTRQGYKSRGGTVTYTVGGVTYDAASGRPTKNQAKPAAKPQPSSSPRTAAVTSGGGRGGSATPPASRPAGAAKVSSGPPSATHTYKAHGSALHVGRHKTLAEHQAAVAKSKAPTTPATSGVGPVADGKQYAADKEREDKVGRTSGVGPVASGAAYAASLPKKSAATPAKNKLSIQQEIRKRRFNR